MPCPEVISILNVSEIVVGFQGLTVADYIRIVDSTRIPLACSLEETTY